MQPASQNYSILIRRVLFLLLLVLALVVFYSWYTNRHFKIVSTSPSVSNVATISPFFKINFNRQLSNTALNISSTPSVVKSYDISGKTLDIVLITPLDENTQYTIKLNSISSSGNDHIYNKDFVFKPKNLDFNQLSNDQQTVILQQQAKGRNPNSSKTYANFVGFDSLINNGITESQLNDIEQGFVKFSPQASTISVHAPTVKPGPHSASSSNFIVTFVVSIDSTQYNATVSYSDLNSARLQIYNPQTGALVFDSLAQN